MYKATKQWRLDEFVNLFVMEGVLYFLLYVFVPIMLPSCSPFLPFSTR